MSNNPPTIPKAKNWVATGTSELDKVQGRSLDRYETWVNTLTKEEVLQAKNINGFINTLDRKGLEDEVVVYEQIILKNNPRNQESKDELLLIKQKLVEKN